MGLQGGQGALVGGRYSHPCRTRCRLFSPVFREMFSQGNNDDVPCPILSYAYDLLHTLGVYMSGNDARYVIVRFRVN